MKREEITVGQEYVARTGGQDCVVQVVETLPEGWVCLNRFTDRRVLVRAARNFKRVVEATQPSEIVARIAQDERGQGKTPEPPTGERNVRETPSNENARGATRLLMKRLEESRRRAESYGEAPHLIVEARAGTGKTTVIIEGVKKALGHTPSITPSPQQQAVWDVMCQGPRPRTVCILAFNVAIADELNKRLPPGVEAINNHKFGFRVVRNQWPGVRVNQYRLDKLFEQLIGEANFKDARKTRPVVVSATKALVKAAKMELCPLDADDEEETQGLNRILLDLIDHYGIDTEGANGRDYVTKVLTHAPALLRLCYQVEQDMEIDYDDMVWLPTMRRLEVAKYDLLLGDEVQDWNRPQQALARMAGRRLVLVGDSKQAIYGWAGADCESMPRMYEQLFRTKQGCVKLPLTVTRRCSKAVVREANKVVPDFEAHESNPEGLVRRLSFWGMDEWEEGHNVGTDYRGAFTDPTQTTEHQNWRRVVRDGDFVLCRVNGPLVTECFRFLREGRRAKIQGRKIGEGLVELIGKLNPTSVQDLLEKLRLWEDKEVAKERAKKTPSEMKVSEIYEKASCVRFFCEGEHDVVGTVQLVVARINSLFTDDPNSPGIILSSIHRAKGLESKRVFFLQPKRGQCPHPSARSQWEQEQEFHLWYVAVTRSIEELYHVIEV